MQDVITVQAVKGVYRPTQKGIIQQIYAAMPEEMHTIDVYTYLKAEAEQAEDPLYYRTDHHWTTYGAYVGYKAWCDALGTQPMDKSMVQNTVSEDFRGTIYSKLNDPYFGTDTIVSWSDPNWDLSVEYSDTEEVTDTPYNSEYLTQKDQYSYFLNNIHPLVTITNHAVSDGAIAVVKDSYANSFVPFLLNHYHTVYIFDTRYHKGGVSKFINSHEDIKDVLILYNTGTLDKDTGIGGIY